MSGCEAAAAPAGIQCRAEAVVLLHGLGAGGVFMLPLAHRLRRAGYQVVNLAHGRFERFDRE